MTRNARPSSGTSSAACPPCRLPYAWQTDTCIGNWHYDRGLYTRNGYKSARTVVQMLANIVSKNGNLLLNIPVRGDGTIDEKEEGVLKGIANWMDVNKECIFGTRPWVVFGEGPASDGAPISAQGFNEGKGKPLTAEDVRFTTKAGVLYAILMDWPGNARETTIKALAKGAPGLAGQQVASVSMLGDPGKLTWSQTDAGLQTRMPAQAPCEGPVVLKIALTPGS